MSMLLVLRLNDLGATGRVLVEAAVLVDRWRGGGCGVGLVGRGVSRSVLQRVEDLCAVLGLLTP